VIVAALGDDAGVLTGFVLPKFTDASGGAFFEALDDTADHLGHRYYAMPVLESAEVVQAETRQDTLTGVARLLAKRTRRIIVAATIRSTSNGSQQLPSALVPSRSSAPHRSTTPPPDRRGPSTRGRLEPTSATRHRARMRLDIRSASI